MDKRIQIPPDQAVVRSAIADPKRLDAVLRTSLLDTPPEECFDHLTRLAAKLTGAPVTFVSLVDANRDFYKSTYGFDEPLASARQMEGRTFCHHALVAGGPLVLDDVTQVPVYRDVPTVESLGVRAYAGVPLVTDDGQVLGSFCAIDFKTKNWTELDIEILSVFAHSAMREIALRQAITDTTSVNSRLAEQMQKVDELNQRLEVLSKTDSLTGLHNRRSFEQSLVFELAIIERKSTPLSLLVVDIDHFKQLNDEHGHAAGDKALQTIAALLNSCTRSIELVARIGSEEFAVILPGADETSALVVAERMRSTVATADWRDVPLTVSVGTATRLNGEDFRHLLARADGAMYVAKQRGRNRVAQA